MEKEVIEPRTVANIRLQYLLDEKGWTQRYFSKLVDIRQATINEMCTNSVAMISVANIPKICEALGCDVEDLIELIPVEEANKRHTKDDKRVKAKLDSLK